MSIDSDASNLGFIDLTTTTLAPPPSPNAVASAAFAGQIAKSWNADDVGTVRRIAKDWLVVLAQDADMSDWRVAETQALIEIFIDEAGAEQSTGAELADEIRGAFKTEGLNP